MNYIGGIGHLASAFIGGMPLGPLHVIVALSMALIVFIFQVIYENEYRISASIFVIIANRLIAPIPMLFFFGMEFYIALLPSLFVGALINTLIALVVAPRFQHVFERVAL